LLCVLVAVFAFDAPHRAFGQHVPARVTLVLASGLTLHDVLAAHDPVTQCMRDQGALALLSPGQQPQHDADAHQLRVLYAGDDSLPDAGFGKQPFISPGLRAPATKAAVDVTSAPVVVYGAPINVLRTSKADLAADLGAAFEAAPNNIFLVCCPIPPRRAGHGWDSLTPVILYGPPMVPGTTLTSETTHTVGLVALRDVMPTVLALAGTPLPASMTGHPMTLRGARPGTPDPAAWRTRILSRMDNVTRINQHVLLPVGWGLGLAAGAALLMALLGLARPDRHVSRAVPYIVRLVMAVPFALMVAPLANPQTESAYGLLVLGIIAVAALAPWANGIMLGTAILIVADQICGTSMVAQSALSGYYLSGIRFYGVGNEYMGILIGGCLIAAFLDKKALPGRSELAMIAGGFAVAAFALAWPGYGAKAGGAVTSAAFFIPAWWAASGKGKATVGLVALSCLIGFAAVLVMSSLASHLGVPATHIQDATSALHHRAFARIANIAVRKLGLEVATILTPGVLTAIIGLSVTWLAVRKHAVIAEVRRFMGTRPALRVSLGGLGWSLAATVLFNDSGAVAAFLIFGIVALSVLHDMVIDR